jgi:hypothetical protein
VVFAELSYSDEDNIEVSIWECASCEESHYNMFIYSTICAKSKRKYRYCTTVSVTYFGNDDIKLSRS